MAIQQVSATDTPNAGRVKWNANDTELDADVTAVEGALTTHKTSSDHDGRYYTETEVDALVDAVADDLDTLDGEAVKVTGDQTIAGVKTLTDNPIIKNASPTLTLENADASLKARIQGYTDGDDEVLVLQMEKSTGNFEDLLSTVKSGTTLDSPDRDLCSRGKQVATQEYVQERLKSGTFVIPLTKYIATLAAGTFHFLQGDGQNIYMAPPVPSRLVGVSAMYMDDYPDADLNAVQDFTADFSLLATEARVLRAQLVAYVPSGVDLGVKLEIYSVTALGVETLIFSEDLESWQGPPDHLYVSVSLRFSL